MSTLSGSFPWAILLFTLKDTSNKRDPKEKFEAMFTGNDSYGLPRYWQNMSGGRLDLDGTEVFGWEEIGYTVDEIQSISQRHLYLRKVVRHFEEQRNEDLSEFEGVVCISPSDLGDAGKANTSVATRNGRKTVPGILASETLYVDPTFFAHEMGHGYGLDHAFDDSSRKAESWSRPGEYYDQWDVMGGGAHVFLSQSDSGLSFGRTGPGLSAPKLAELGWLDTDEIWNKPAWRTQVNLTSLSRPSSGGSKEYRAVKIPFKNHERGRTEAYWVEYRTPERWDQGTPEPAVLIRRVAGGTAYLINRDPDAYDPKWKEGDTYEDGRSMISIEVASLGEDGAVIGVNRYGGVGFGEELSETSDAGPDLVRAGDQIVLAWKGKGNQYLNTLSSDVSDAESGFPLFRGKQVHMVESPSSPETFRFNNRKQNNFSMAWDPPGSGPVQFAKAEGVGSVIENGRETGPTKPLFKSKSSPSATKFDGSTWMAFSAEEGSRIRVLFAPFNVGLWGEAETLDETTPVAPAICGFDGHLYIAWKGLGNDKVNVIRSTDGRKFQDKIILDEETEHSPCLVSHRGELLLAWTGKDGRLNVMQSQDGKQWADKTILSETSIASPALLSVGKKLVWAWTKDDKENSLGILAYQE
jgi:M6 family metalloprotease-like protein